MTSETPPLDGLFARMMRVIQRDPSLPTFAITAEKLLELCKREDVSMEEIAGVVKLDPGLTGKYLRLANSPAFLTTEKIGSVEDALVRIGMEEVRKLASLIAVVDVCHHFRTNIGAPHIDWQAFWLHNLMTARLTEQVAGQYRDTSGREHLAGLLHDVGKLFWEHYFPTEFQVLLDHISTKSCDMYEAECLLFDTNHADVGWALCERWSLEPEICRAVRFYHDPGAAYNKDDSTDLQPTFLPACLCVANALSKVALRPEIDAMRLPEWSHLEKFPKTRPVSLNLMQELEFAQHTIDSLLEVQC